MLPPLVRILLPAAVAFSAGMALTPLLTHYLYKYKAWKKRPGKLAFDGEAAHEFNRLHSHHEVRAPRMGGIVVWGSVVLTILGIAALANMFQGLEGLNFLSRNQTWLPFATLVIGALIGFVDDLMVIRENAEGLRLHYPTVRVVVSSASVVKLSWAKLGMPALNIPSGAPLDVVGHIDNGHPE